MNDYNEFVPLGAVSKRQLDLTQREVTGARPTAETEKTGYWVLKDSCKPIRNHCSGPDTILLQLLESLLQLLGSVGVRDV